MERTKSGVESAGVAQFQSGTGSPFVDVSQDAAMTASPTHVKYLIVTRLHLVRFGWLIARILEDLWEELIPGKNEAKKVPKEIRR
jgi:hypothetical protein